MEAPLIVYDRSRTVQDWKCERSRLYQYEWDGKGVVLGTTFLELYLGTAIHDGLAAIAAQHVNGEVDIDLIASTAYQEVFDSMLNQQVGEIGAEEFAAEQGTMVEGLLRGFYKGVWPKLMEAYPVIIAIEQEMRYDHDGLVFMSKPDLVVADKEECLWYIEYKSTASKKEEWINSWQTAVQLHSTCKAVEQSVGEPVTGVIVQGLYKGYKSYGRQNSPFCYAYHKAGNPPFSEDQFLYEYRSGFKRYPTWMMKGGVKGWIEGMHPDFLAAQFPQTPPIFINESLVNAFFQQRDYREHEIAEAAEWLNSHPNDEDRGLVLAQAFPQRFDQCIPSFGKPCPYRLLCHGGVTDPLNHGYTYRESHHALEVELDAQENDG